MERERELSERQLAMLVFIQEFTAEKGYSPTIREIGDGCNIPSTSNVSYNIGRLIEMGDLQKDNQVARGVILVEHA